MSAHRVGFIRCVIPLAAIVAFAVAMPFGSPAADMVGGHCQLGNNKCNNSSWTGCQGPPVPCGTLMQCHCNGFAANRCAATTSCNDLNDQCSPDVGCFCSANDMCIGHQ